MEREAYRMFMRNGRIQGINWTLKYRAAFVGLLVKVNTGAVAVTVPLKAVNGTARFVVDQI